MRVHILSCSGYLSHAFFIEDLTAGNLDAIIVVTGGIQVCPGCRNLIPDLAAELGLNKITIIDTARRATVDLFGPGFLDANGRSLSQIFGS